MRIAYAVAGVIAFSLFLVGIAPEAVEGLQITDDAGWLALAIVFAGGLAGGD